MTEEQTGGTTPETEATASVDDQASEQAAGVAIADEPAETIAAATTETSEPPAPAALESIAVSEDQRAASARPLSTRSPRASRTWPTNPSLSNRLQ